jgi:hypothetical protein
MKNRVLVAIAAVLLMSAGAAFAQNSLQVLPGAALNGTNFGMQVNVGTGGGSTNAVYVQSDHPTAETHMRTVMRIKADTLNAPATGAGRNYRFANIVDSDDPALPHKVFFLQRQTTTGNWRLAVWNKTAADVYEFLGGAFHGTYGPTSPDVKWDCDWTMGGAFTCDRTVGATTQQDVINVATVNDAGQQADSFQFGFFDFDGFPGTAAAGSCKHDEVELYR